MVMLRRKGDDTSKVKKPTRLHFYIFIGIVAFFILTNITAKIISYYHMAKDDESTVEFPTSTNEEYKEFFEHHTQQFEEAREDLLEFDQLYFHPEPIIYGEEMEKRIDEIVELCDEAMDFPYPEDYDLRQINETYIQSLRDFKKAVRMYPESYQESRVGMEQSMEEVQSLLAHHRYGFEAALRDYESYTRSE